MAKNIDYPRASLSNALQLCEAVEALGGGTTAEMAADKMGRKLSGAFAALTSAAVKYSLASSKDGRLSTTPLYRNIKLAYSEDEKRGYLRTALLSPPVFEAVAQRFSGKQLPIEHFDRLLIREFGVSDEIASRVATYFIEGARQAGMLGADNVFVSSTAAEEREEPRTRNDEARVSEQDDSSASGEVVTLDASRQQSQYSVTFRGPGLSSTVIISDEDDVAIVQATLKKITKLIVSPM